MADLRSKGLDRFFRAGEELSVIPDLREPKKIQGADRAGGRLGAVVVLFQTQQNAGIVPCAAEVSTSVLIEEQLILDRLEFYRKTQPADIERRFVKIE